MPPKMLTKLRALKSGSMEVILVFTDQENITHVLDVGWEMGFIEHELVNFSTKLRM